MKAILILLFIFSSALHAQRMIGPENVEEMKLEVLARINQQRADLGLGAVVRDLGIEEIIQEYTEKMADGEARFGHGGFSNRCKEMRLITGGNMCGEILAWGHPNAEAVHRGWVNSPGHNSTMIQPRYTHAGLAYKMNSNGRRYWSVLFLER